MLQESELREAAAERLEVGVVRGEQGFTALQEAWSELLEHSQASVFSSWQWLHAWYRRLGGSRRPFILCARSQAQGLVGLLPLYVEQRCGHGLRYRHLGLLGDEGVGSDHLGPVVRQGAEPQAVAALARGLLQHRAEWDLLELLEVDEDSLSVRELVAQLCRAGLGLRSEERYECPYEPFEPGLTFERLLMRTQRADNFRRRRRWLERQPGFKLERARAGEEVQRALDTFFRLHAMRWQGRSGVNRVESFHREAAAGLAERGWLRVYNLWVGETPVASVYGLVHAGTFSYYNAGYDPAWRDKSVGLVLVGMTFQEALAEGCREYDFLRGMEPYKSDWTTRTRRTVGLRLWHPWGAGAWVAHTERLARQARQRLREVLPERVVELLRQARGAWARG